MDPGQTSAVRDLYKRHFGALPAHIVRVPAAVELLGCSTVLADGLCLSAALDRFVYVASSPRDDGKIELVSSTFPSPERFPVDRLQKNSAAPWAHFPKSVLAELRRRQVHYSGFNAAIVDEIPTEAGMGRFAALQVATALTIRRLWPFRLAGSGLTTAPNRGPRGELPPLDAGEKVGLARLCQDAQNHYLGLQSSLVDQLTSLSGCAWHLMALDLRFTTVEPLPLIGCVFVLCRLSGVSRVTSPLTRQTCDAAAQRLGVKSLRSLEAGDLPGVRKKLPETDYRAAVHVVGEMARVVAAERALRNEDVAQFGAYLLQSHQLLLSLESVPAELGALVELARKHRVCMGARVIGQSVLCLVPHHQAAEFVEYLRSAPPGEGAMETTVLQTADIAS